MHIQAGQCGNQIGAKVRPRAAPLRRAPHPARIPRPPPPPRAGPRGEGSREAVRAEPHPEPHSPLRSLEEKAGPALAAGCRDAGSSPLPFPPPPFLCPYQAYFGPAGAQRRSAAKLHPPAAAGAGRWGGRWLGVALFSGVTVRPRARWVGWAGLGGARPKAIMIPPAPGTPVTWYPPRVQSRPVHPPSFDHPQLPGPTLFLCWGRNWARTRDDLG